MREFLKGLELDKDTIDTIMAEYGKNVQGLREQLEEYKEKFNEVNEKFKDSANAREELDNLKNELAEKQQKEKALKDDELLTNNILSVFGERKFTSEYAKNGLMNDIKAQLKKEENQGKGVKDIFDELVKDRGDIFANPNQIQDMPSMGDVESGVTKEAFDKMSYKQRVEFKETNPELFAKYNI